jgi:glycosyltransferase involved in cell wall biosynthesis
MNSVSSSSLVSIITVVYNGEASLERTIKSVAAQTYPHIEYIIIDGGSTDGTHGIIERYKENISTFVSEKDKGIADAMNKGIARAKGALVGIINADDWLESNAVTDAVETAIKFPGAVVHGDMRVWIDEKKFYLAKAPDTINMKKGMVVNHSSVFVPMELYKEYGVFSLDYKIVFDWELMLRFYMAGVSFVKTGSLIADFSSGGISTEKPRLLVDEMHRVRTIHKTYSVFDYYYIKNLIRMFFVGSSLIHVSQRIRLFKYRISGGDKK